MQIENSRATLSVQETAQYLGLGRGKMYSLIKKGKIPYLKFGKSIRIPRNVLDDWIVSQCKTM